MLTGVSVSSQSLPVPINYNGVDGVFITINMMDNVSLKLIDRNVLLSEQVTLLKIIENIKSQNSELLSSLDLVKSQNGNYKNLLEKTEAQKSILLESLNDQKQITKNLKRRSFKNGLLYFGGGLTIGFAAFTILVN